MCIRDSRHDHFTGHVRTVIRPPSACRKLIQITPPGRLCRPPVREVDRQSYRLTAALYGRIDDRLGEVFRQSYLIGRTHYSAKCSHALAFVRTCQLCRRAVIRGYVAVAEMTGIRTIFLGMNEWTSLSAQHADGVPHVSGTRHLL